MVDSGPLGELAERSQDVESSYAMRLVSDHPTRSGYPLKARVIDVAVTVIEPAVVSRLLARKREHDALDELTEREHEALGLVAEGLTSRARPPCPIGQAR